MLLQLFCLSVCVSLPSSRIPPLVPYSRHPAVSPPVFLYVEDGVISIANINNSRES